MASKHTQILKKDYPWVTSPLIASAPMRLIATPTLAIEVSLAGGLGFLGVGTDITKFSPWLNEASSILQSSPILNASEDVLPIGVGFICWGVDLPTALSIFSSAPQKPAAAWLFAPKDSKDLVSWTEGIRQTTDGNTKIWIQVGTVAMALDIVKSCKPDVLVIQGADAGGHGLAQSSSIISLLPECADALATEGFGNIPLIGAGGIMDGRGVAAALTLGASGACMGTRFLATPEAVISQGYKNAVVEARDGGVATARTTVYDKIRGTIGWPESYNARGVLNQSFWDNDKGMSDEENERLYEEEIKKGDAGWGDQGRMTTYAGTGVGLIQKIQPAGGIVREVLKDAKERLAATRGLFKGSNVGS
ncbi:related to FMN-dependent 2-nitropropane dioxygenase [Phialocephala subalpina]|uniref:Related to FMN-dependent 2-nitropropane dioxygenase n=1 Tax=Phialocephala subalpina TaxID=576137 RepID=A0A1L7WYU1_9HELO|nr:related to FMN-dependent 2-nitropropane dioxygenase [Phialocephala subalpina]